MNSKNSALAQSFSIFLLDLQAEKFHKNFTSVSISISTRTSGYVGTLRQLEIVVCATSCAGHMHFCVLHFIFFAFVCLLLELRLVSVNLLQQPLVTVVTVVELDE